jgi:hypothetical protein
MRNHDLFAAIRAGDLARVELLIRNGAIEWLPDHDIASRAASSTSWTRCCCGSSPTTRS